MGTKVRKISTNDNVVVKIISGPNLGVFKIILNVLAVLVSWYFNKSILWAIFHFFFGFWYLLYSLVVGRFADGGFMEIIKNFF